MFSKKERSTFPYWFAHWCAFNMTALNLRVWKFKYLFHDIEKPWLMLLWRDYKRVQKYHRTHNRHHLEYNGKRGYDYMAMIIDWECSRFTKKDAPMDAWQTLKTMMDESKDKKYRQKLYINLAYTLLDLKLTSIFGVNILHDNMLYDYIENPQLEYDV